MWSKELMVLSLRSKHGQRPQILWSREMITSFCSASESPPRCICSYVIIKAMSVPFQRISGPRLSMLTISVAWSHYHYSLWMGCKSIKSYPSPPYISYIAGCPPGFKRGSARLKHLPQEHNITTVWPVTRSQVQSLWKTFWLIKVWLPKTCFWYASYLWKHHVAVEHFKNTRFAIMFLFYFLWRKMCIATKLQPCLPWKKWVWNPC